MVIGGGVVGMNAAFIAIGMEAEVYVYDRNIDRLRELDIYFAGRASTCYASTLEIEQRLPEVDLVIGAVLVHGAKAPYVIRREQLALMKHNAVLVDVSIDQGGCFETSRPTTHSDPTYEVDGITHYCVANMPGAVPVTSTYALTNATLPYVVDLADMGVAAACAPRTRGWPRASTWSPARSPTCRWPRRPGDRVHPAARRAGRGRRRLRTEVLGRAGVVRRAPRSTLLPSRAVCRRPPSSCARAARLRRRSSPPRA